MRWYVYKFMQGDVCMYVGKGSGNRFKSQCSRFKDYKGEIVRRFETEGEALTYERGLIKTFAPPCNKAQMPKDAKSWRKVIKPPLDEQWDVWMDALGSRQMAARILVAKGWTALSRYGVTHDAYKRMLMMIDMECTDHLRTIRI